MAEEVVELVLARRPYPVTYNLKVHGFVVLYGYSIKETTGGAVAELDIYDGFDTAGVLAVPIPLSAGQGAEDWFGPQGLHLRVGLNPVVASGSIAGSIWIADEPRDRGPR